MGENAVRARTRARAMRFVVAVGIAALMGCSTNCAPATWELAFATPELETATRAVTVLVRTGTCSAPGAIVDARTLMRGAMRATPRTLGPGPFALEARALDATCTLVASSCVDLPAGSCPATIHQTLVGVTGASPECGMCVDGVCPDGGDAGLLPDAYVCSPNETSCDDGRDEDCDGRADCADSECDQMPSSCGGVCLGGACCGGCWTGSSCSSGRSRHACGRGGDACVDCGSCACGATGTCGC